MAKLNGILNVDQQPDPALAFRTIYTVPLHVGENIEVPAYAKVTFYDPVTKATLPAPQRFMICGDDSGHEYFIPVDRAQEFESWVAAMESGGDDTQYADFDIYRIEGRFTFVDPRRD